MNNFPRFISGLRAGRERCINEAIRGRYSEARGEVVPERLARSARAGPNGTTLATAAVRVVLAVAVAATVGGTVGWQLRAILSAPASTSETREFARSAAMAHATYSPEVRHAVEVGADEEPHLIAWLSKRLGAPVRAPKLDPAGYSLLGGRLLPGEPSSTGLPLPRAHFMYQNASGERLTLCMRADYNVSGKAVLRSARQGNVSVVYWLDGKLGYALSSGDTGPDGLLRIAELAQRQLRR